MDEFLEKYKPIFWTWQDGLDPEYDFMTRARVDVNLDTFLSTDVAIVKTKRISVKDIILHTANVMGGVHLAAPKDERQRVIDSMNEIWVANLPSVLRTLLPIGRVVSRAVDDLYCDTVKVIERR